jgi:alpha-tubulin suppressor-like RCC1 family protein
MQSTPSDTISCGRYYTVVVTRDGKVVGWGSNEMGQCDAPAGLDHVVAVSAGDSHTAALTQDGKVVCWGRNGNSQCAVPNDLSNVIAISCGGFGADDRG